MEVIEKINEEERVPSGVVSEVVDEKVLYSGIWNITDWKAASDEFFTDLAQEVSHHGLRVYMAVGMDDDQYYWRIGK